MRAFISAAAASVKVTTSSSSTSHGGEASQTRYAQRSASTAVFPDPAAADTSRLRPVVAMAAHCSSVHFVPSGLDGITSRVIARPFQHLIEHFRSFHRREIHVLV